MKRVPGSSSMAADPHLMKALLSSQRAEITENQIYTRIAAGTQNPRNRGVLERIAEEELGHYRTWKQYTGKDVAPDTLRILFYCFAAWLLGMTFTLKMMESVERRAQAPDPALVAAIPEIPAILAREDEHEQALIALIDEDRLRYTGSVVLGLNDAIVEFTGMLAGLTFALQDSRIIAVAALITGVAAALSMGSSEYLSQKSEPAAPDPVRAAGYTGSAYMVVVVLLIFPYLLLRSPYHALVFTLLCAVAVIFFFTYYLSVAKDLPFRSRFAEMLAISFGIAAVSFVIGLAIRVFFSISV